MAEAEVRKILTTSGLSVREVQTTTLANSSIVSALYVASG